MIKITYTWGGGYAPREEMDKEGHLTVQKRQTLSAQMNLLSVIIGDNGNRQHVNHKRGDPLL
jgi:hypothetical protein